MDKTDPAPPAGEVPKASVIASRPGWQPQAATAPTSFRPGPGSHAVRIKAEASDTVGNIITQTIVDAWVVHGAAGVDVVCCTRD